MDVVSIRNFIKGIFMNMHSYPSPMPHGPIEQLFDNVFWVHGSVKLAPAMTMNRNMVIIKDGSKLTLINPVRLNKSEEVKLEQLGDICRVMRLGDFHGLDDRYYVDKYQTEFWCQHGSTTYSAPTPSHIIESGIDSPITNSTFFVFEKAKFPEAALLMTDHKLLITTDSIQHHSDWSYTNFLGRITLKLMGFELKTQIGKPWLKRVTAKGDSLKPDFDRLCALDFDTLLAAHGTPLKSSANQVVSRLVGELYS